MNPRPFFNPAFASLLFAIAAQAAEITTVTPKWVHEAGAKGILYQYNKGPVKEGVAWDPVFKDPFHMTPYNARKSLSCGHWRH